MKKTISLLSLAILLLILAACSSTSQVNTSSVSVQSTQPVKPADDNESAVNSIQRPAAASEDQTREDSQGAVEISVNPVNLNAPGDFLEFKISMNTHSVDLGMDLARLSTLTTDTGLSVQGSKWDAPSGGHHVGGNLSFPAIVNGKPILQGAKKMTLTIINVDAPQRTFTWELP